MQRLGSSRPPEAITTWRCKSSRLPSNVARGGLSALRIAQFAFAYGRMGREEDAARFFTVLEDLPRDEPVPQAVWAMAYCAIADYDEAYRRLEIIVSAPPIGDQFALAGLKANSFGDPVLDEPRWQELRGRIGELD